MSRVRLILVGLVSAVWMLGATLVGVAQVVEVQLQTAVARDAGSPQTNERRIPVGSSTISGTVVVSDTGAPVASARVSLNGNAGTAWLTRTVVTDARGQFSFPRLPAGAFKISVSSTHNQFFPTNYGERRPGGEGRHIQLADGQALAIRVPMQRGAVITGIVTGPDGTPMRFVNVTALRQDMTSGTKRSEMVGSANTDDRGVYRLFGLRPGDYIVAARPNVIGGMGDDEFEQIERLIAAASVIAPSAPGTPAMVSLRIAPSRSGPRSMHDYTPTGYLPIFAPSSLTSAAAHVVTLRANDERTGVDIRVQLVPASNILGSVSPSVDAGLRVQLTLQNDDSSAMHSTRSAQPDQNGNFAFSGIEPGEYTLRAQVIPGGLHGIPGAPAVLTDAQKMWGQTRVSVNGERSIRVSLDLQPTRSISGIVLFDMQRQPDFTRNPIEVTARPAESSRPIYFPDGPPKAVMSPDGRFTITGVPAGRYVIDVNWSAKSSVVAGQDTLDFPLEFTGDRDITDAVVTLSDRRSQLSGTLSNSAGKPALDYVIVVASTDDRYWGRGSRRVQTTRSDQTGRFMFGLPPGQYQISVIEDLEGSELHNPEFLRMLARTSVSVTITDGGKVTQNLQVK